MMKIPGLTLLLSNPSDMSIEDVGCNFPVAGDISPWTESSSAQRMIERPPTMDRTSFLVQLPVEVEDLSIPPKRELETQDSDRSKRRKTDTSSTAEPVTHELTVDVSLSIPLETQGNNDSQAPETVSSETLTKKQRKKRNRLVRLQATVDAFREQTASQAGVLQHQQTAVPRERATQQGEAAQQLRAGLVNTNSIPSITNVPPIAVVTPAVPVSIPVIPPVRTPPIAVPSNTISAENWLRAGIPKSPFNNTPYSRSQLETAWQSFDLPSPNIYQFPIPHLVIVRLHFLSTLWRYAKLKGTYHVTTPTIGGIGFEAMRFLIHHLGCPVVRDTEISKGKHVYIIELKYAPCAPRLRKGYKFLGDAVSVEAEKEALTSLEKTWRAKLACAAIVNSSASTTKILAGPPTSDVRINVSPFPKTKSQSEGGQVIRAAESRLAELKSQLVQAKNARSSTQKPDEQIDIVDAPLVPVSNLRVPRRKAVDFFDAIELKRIPSPPLTVPDEGDHWGRLNYEKRMGKVDLGAIDAFFGMVLEL